MNSRVEYILSILCPYFFIKRWCDMNLIKANEIIQYQFYAIPKALFTEEKYINLSTEAKIIYSFLLDRIGLSQRNYWYDEENNVYLIFKRKDISELLNISEKTIIKAVKELKNVDLLYEKRQGLRKT